MFRQCSARYAIRGRGGGLHSMTSHLALSQVREKRTPDHFPIRTPSHNRKEAEWRTMVPKISSGTLTFCETSLVKKKSKCTVLSEDV